MLQNGAKALSKMVLKNSRFCQKHHNFVHFGPYNLVHILPAYEYDLNTYQIMYGETFNSLPVSAFATVALKISNSNITAKIHFPIGHFMLPFLTLTLKI